jgi:uncharacterized protein YcbK (DUF882 family)
LSIKLNSVFRNFKNKESHFVGEFLPSLFEKITGWMEVNCRQRVSI